MKIAILDDYQGLALKLADWTQLQKDCDITVFQNHLDPITMAPTVLALFDIICLVRERMAVPRSLIFALDKLKFIAATGPHNRTIDFQAVSERGIIVSHTHMPGGVSHDTVELTWGLILALARRIPQEVTAMRSGLWQTTLGTRLRGKTLGLLGLGRLGAQVAQIGLAFGMRVAAWSENLTSERAQAAGAVLVPKERLFEEADVLSVHLVLGDRTRSIVESSELSKMKKTALLVNTSRGPIIDQTALIEALQSGWLAGAALDVYDEEPLPPSHPLRALPNTILTPHLGYVTEESMRSLYEQTVENILGFIAGSPIRRLSA